MGGGHTQDGGLGTHAIGEVVYRLKLPAKARL